jgi:hypothetical protein
MLELQNCRPAIDAGTPTMWAEFLSKASQCIAAVSTESRSVHGGDFCDGDDSR